VPHPTHLPCPTFCPALHLCPVLDFHPYTFAPPYIRTRHYTLVPPYSFIPTHLPRPTLLPHPTYLSYSTCLIRSTHLSHSTCYFLHIEWQKTPGGVSFLSGFQIKRQVDSEEDPCQTEPLLLWHNPPCSSFRKHPERKPRGGGGSFDQRVPRRTHLSHPTLLRLHIWPSLDLWCNSVWVRR